MGTTATKHEKKTQENLSKKGRRRRQEDKQNRGEHCNKLANQTVSSNSSARYQLIPIGPELL